MRPLWLMTQSMFLIGLILRQPTACLWLCESRCLTYLAPVLCAQGTVAQSSLSSYCESDNWPKCHAIHSLVFNSAPPITTLDSLLEDYMPGIPLSLYVTVHLGRNSHQLLLVRHPIPILAISSSAYRFRVPRTV